MLGLVVPTMAIGAPITIDPTASALARAIDGHRIVLLGEVHDNAAQHALRAAALRRILEKGARPAIVFEQFDRDRQSDIDRARRERPRDADHVISRAKSDSGWRWNDYRPLIALALEYDLPIVAGNLSRKDAMRVATSGWSAALDARTVAELELDALRDDFLRKHVDAIAAGHCNRLPTESLVPTAHAQIARDIVMARAIEPYLDRGVVLLAGNGHVRRDIGVPHWLPRDSAKNVLSIGLLERDANGTMPSSDRYDAYVVTQAAIRDDPCKQLK